MTLLIPMMSRACLTTSGSSMNVTETFRRKYSLGFIRRDVNLEDHRSSRCARVAGTQSARISTNASFRSGWRSKTPARRSFQNTLRGPREVDLDSSLEKHFPITEGTALLLRFEFFNMFNHPQFQVPAAVINSGGAGTITATANTARQIQAALRFTF